MNIPRFTAEASLSRNSGYFQISEIMLGPFHEEVLVRPALRIVILKNVVLPLVAHGTAVVSLVGDVLGVDCNDLLARQLDLGYLLLHD